MTIRTAAPDDLDDIRALLDGCDLPSRDLTVAHLEHFLVSHDDNDLRAVGGIEPHGHVALLRSVAVAPAHRGNGLGARLTGALERKAREHGIRALYLLTTTASGYFRSRGYQSIDRAELPSVIQETEQAAQICPASATCMRKPLPTAAESAP